MKMDAIEEKIYRHGWNSLTDEEKKEIAKTEFIYRKQLKHKSYVKNPTLEYIIDKQIELKKQK